MADEIDIKRLGGKLAWEIEKEEQRLEGEIKEVRRRIEGVEKVILPNGRPSLEDRLREYACQEVAKLRTVVDHKVRNAQQDDADLLEAIKENGKRINEVEDKQDLRHEENIKQFTSINVRLAMCAGAVIVLQPLFALWLGHMFGK